MPTALTIAGVDTGGGAGIAADLKTFAALGVHGTCAITSITAQNTRGVQNSYDIPVEFIEDQFDAVVSDISIDSAKTGMLSSPEIVMAVVNLIKNRKFPLVIDPVMAAAAGGELLKAEAVSVLIEELIPLCTAITPNVGEAERLSGMKIMDMKDAKKAAKKIHDLGARAVIVTGGHLDGTDVYYDGEVTYIEGTLLKGGTHGSGCTHSAAIAAEIAKGTTLIDAASIAKKFVEKAILKSVEIGAGVSPVNQIGPILAEAERFHVQGNVEEAVALIEKHVALELIPEVGCNIAMGISHAVSTKDVAAVSGRIVKFKGRPHAVGCVAFGASSHMARIVLTTMKAEGSIKAAMNTRYSHDAISACKELGFEIQSFSRDEEPEGVSTMEWGASEVITKDGKVPDVIYDTGGVGKEAMIRLLGKNAMEVAGMAVDISRAMIRYGFLVKSDN